MSREYAEKKIRTALAQAKGNATRARQMIIGWCAEDHQLLLALTRPHMTGVVAHAVSRVMQRKEVAQESPPATPDHRAVNVSEASFGQQILGAMQGRDAVHFGREPTAPLGRRKASQAHIDALNMIAKSGKNGKR